MANRGKSKSDEFYCQALRGAREIHRDGTKTSHPGLRSFASGFDAASGYDLRSVNKWTPAQKRKVSIYFNELQNLTAQEKKVFHPRNKEHLRQAQAIGGHDKKLKQFVVAFVPGSINAKVKFTKDGITIREPDRNYWRIDREFNQKRLATNPKAEIKRVLDTMPGAQRYQIIAGPNLIMNMYDGKIVEREILRLQLKYDGHSEIRSGNKRGADPTNHDYRKWLHGLIGYQFPSVKRDTVINAMHEISTQNAAIRKQRAARRRRSKNRKDK